MRLNRFILPLWGENQRAAPREHGCYEGQTRRTAHAQLEVEMDVCCLQGLTENRNKKIGKK